MKKIGIVGGVGWPSTLDYYRLICTKANTHFKGLGIDPPYPTPPIAIESLVMADVRKVRPNPGDSEEAWEPYDAIFRQAFNRLQTAGCDFGLIASNTPHARLHSIRQGVDLPIVSILEETVQVTCSIGADKALVLGTDVTMRSGDYPEILKANGVTPNSPLSDALVDELQQVIDVEFYQGGLEVGHAKLIEICNKQVAYPDTTAVLLACTELPLAFPRHGDDAYFKADGYLFVNTAASHAQAALLKSLGLSG